MSLLWDWDHTDQNRRKRPLLAREHLLKVIVNINFKTLETLLIKPGEVLYCVHVHKEHLTGCSVQQWCDVTVHPSARRGAEHHAVKRWKGLELGLLVRVLYKSQFGVTRKVSYIHITHATVHLRLMEVFMRTEQYLGRVGRHKFKIMATSGRREETVTVGLHRGLWPWKVLFLFEKLI